ncbi:MAG: tRNA (adenosine(37)-N6)-threonylcarbamoyltransferase complex transferase subunit TsaD [Chloroflexi bacterium]|nr:tRNA (adenosine(37)-N6)-threonylcarbamoyltransferase complex transferase subunit TsaD [Chloroflexota bacterium]
MSTGRDLQGPDLARRDPEENIVLGIETSCDETSVALVAAGRGVLCNIVSSQVELHRQYGGVVPEIAARQHLANILPVLDEVFTRVPDAWSRVRAVAVTHGPGLAGALLIGVNAAKALAFSRNLPLVGVNHLEAHIYSNWLYEAGEEAGSEPELPAVALIVSGGHTELILMRDHGRFERLGSTRDDAAGEAFDKVARIVGLSYPGGPAIQRAAEGQLGSSRPGNPQAFLLPRAQLGETLDFSFSGLKTAAQRLIQKQREALASPTIPADLLADLAASFQEAVVAALISQTLTALRLYQPRSLLLAGGVAANARLRTLIRERSTVPVWVPPLRYCTDNAAMVAGAAHFRIQRGCQHGLDLDIDPNLPLVLSSSEAVSMHVTPVRPGATDASG